MSIRHTGYCDICGKKKATDWHHLVYGNANRKLSTEDDLLVNICRDCHDEVHKGNNGTAGHLSKMLGQALWERDLLEKRVSELLEVPVSQDVRILFTQKYGISKL